VNHSGSTRRLRVTAAYYAWIIAVSAIAGGAALTSIADVAVGIVSLALASLAALGRIWCSLFIAGRKDAELVTDGPYALCRHPLYVFSLMGGIGIGMATRSVVLTVSTLIVLATLLIPAALREEQMLQSRYGAVYEAYAARVPRWSLRLWNWPRGAIEVRTPILFKAFLDAGAFLLLYALTDAAYRLRVSAITPTLLAIP
jgi:protein-S-isoprenylcysteine O-methyltransferase Ste14